ncbi:MAG: nucleotide exchange factor GrpE [Deltaproteobacteria bacterium]|jgi:molecular chaperone GrpE|nr:nucleotide exchange factor GrpE [Deltaproteobacteria bacterium]
MDNGERDYQAEDALEPDNQAYEEGADLSTEFKAEDPDLSAENQAEAQDPATDFKAEATDRAIGFEAEEDGSNYESNSPKAAFVPPDWEEEARKYHDLYLRALAETENIRRRAKKETEESYRYAAESLLKGLVPVLDNLHLALNYVDESVPAAKSLAEGVRLTLKIFVDFLAERGLKEVTANRGQNFDPNIHEALGQEPDPELPDLAISREVAKGYALGERLLRPAKVMVVKN